ncbi:zinc-binding alcohol dehydrogenase family protein [Pontibacter sp. G13]|uniref:zinc-binding alcohol dehydrogenase family protein n=1 Tax=Pontibacter sp. G13 TaxID=3074898 RepID=UPI00288C3D83|nr:zinc-binding alcohol dehydrogenase family protein [Pontibacter sp. G13]WNJ19351.1 zinc-binding alcohol dehydrogenase family protein [Pontibacter sp. G13]
MDKMKAIGYEQAGPISAPNALIEIETPTPELNPHDLLVEVMGVSVNPADVKIRANRSPENGAKIIGFDGAGIVKAVGSEVSLFQVGDEVYYAGDITRPGTNAQYHAVDERIVGRKPLSMDFPEAAGMALTSITAWELLFESLGVQEGTGHGEHLLIIGGAGGVGSILIQLAKKLTGLTVIATASRPETQAWVQKMGADHTINHHESLVDQLQALEIQPKYVASLNATDRHFPAILELIKPRGHVAMIDDPKELNITPAKLKALTFSWELMFTRPMFQTPDMIAQHRLLTRVAGLLDAGILQSTVTSKFDQLTPESLMEAHKIQETGKVIGKQVLGGMHHK